MKKTKIIYWIITGIFALLMLASAVPDFLATTDAVAIVNTQLGYPKYITSFLGAAKILGAIVVLIPAFPRLKEWAYAGLAFDLIGATYSMFAIGTSGGKWAFMLIWIAVLFASYFYYHKMLNEKARLQTV